MELNGQTEKQMLVLTPKSSKLNATGCYSFIQTQLQVLGNISERVSGLSRFCECLPSGSVCW